MKKLEMEYESLLYIIIIYLSDVFIKIEERASSETCHVFTIDLASFAMQPGPPFILLHFDSASDTYALELSNKVLLSKQN